MQTWPVAALFIMWSLQTLQTLAGSWFRLMQSRFKHRVNVNMFDRTREARQKTFSKGHGLGGEFLLPKHGAEGGRRVRSSGCWGPLRVMHKHLAGVLALPRSQSFGALRKLAGLRLARGSK